MIINEMNLGAYESNVIDTTDCTSEETVSMVMKKIADWFIVNEIGKDICDN